MNHYNYFEYEYYTTKYKDLSKMNKEQALEHFKKHGIKEKRKFNILLDTFDYNFYTTKHKDLSKFNYLEACNHYIKYGIKEKRLCNNFTVTPVTNKNINQSGILYLISNKNINWLNDCKKFSIILKNYNINTLFIENTNLTVINKYKYILLDGCLLNIKIYNNFSIFKEITSNIILLIHDLHPWSIGNNLKSDIEHKLIINSIDSNTYYNHIFSKLREINIIKIISYYDNFELEKFKNNLPKIDFYIHPFYINDNIYNKLYCNKIYDISIYGCNNYLIYPLRSNISNFLVKFNKNKINFINSKDNELNKDINKSWITIATSSKYNYFVRKYMEISNTTSTLMCNSLPIINKYFKHAYIFIPFNISEVSFNNTYNYYISNKELLVYLFSKLNINVKSLYINNYAKNILNIVNNNGNLHKYQNFKKYSLLNFINYIYIKKEISFLDINKYTEIIYVTDKIKNNLNLQAINDNKKFYYFVEKNSYKNFNKIENDDKFNVIMKHEIIEEICISENLQYFAPFLYSIDFIRNKNINTPKFYYGLWTKNDYNNLLRNLNIKVLIFTGGDINYFLNHKLKNQILKLPNLYIIAISKSIKNLLIKNNIKHIYFNFYNIPKTINYNNTTNTRNNILCYSSYDIKTYNFIKLIGLEKKLPQYKFIFTTNEAHYKNYVKNKSILDKLLTDSTLLNKLKVYTYDEIQKMIQNTFICLRLTNLDGLSSLSIECALQGIKSLNNSIGTEYCIEYTEANIIDKINYEYKRQNNKDSINYRNSVINYTKKLFTKPLYFNTSIYYKYNINYYFDKIYVLNLKKDINKKEKIIKNFYKYNINNYEFFDALDGSLNGNVLNIWNDYNNRPYNELEKKLNRHLISNSKVLANLLSVKNIILDAKKNNYKRILFFEDDIILHKNFNDYFIDTMCKIQDNEWKVLYFGIQNKLNNKKILNNLYKADLNSSGGWAFGIDNSIYDILINECNNLSGPFDDGPLKKIRTLYPNECLVFYPNIAICNVGESGIRTGRCMEDFSHRFNWNLNEYDL